MRASEENCESTVDRGHGCLFILPRRYERRSGVCGTRAAHQSQSGYHSHCQEAGTVQHKTERHFEDCVLMF